MQLLIQTLTDLVRAIVRLADRLPVNGLSKIDEHRMQEQLFASEIITRRLEHVARSLAQLDARTP